MFEKINSFFLDVCDGINDYYYGALDFLDQKGVPIYKVHDFLDQHGIPPLAALAVLLLLLIILSYFLLLSPTVATVPFAVVVQDEAGNSLNAVSVTITYNHNNKTVNIAENRLVNGTVRLNAPLGSTISISAVKSQYKLLQNNEIATFTTEKLTEKDQAIRVRMRKETGTVSAKLQYFDGQANVSDKVEVYATYEDGPAEGIKGTLINDYISFATLPKGISITFTARNSTVYDDLSTSFTFQEDSERRINLEVTNEAFLAGKSKLEFIVLDEFENPIANAEIELRDASTQMPIEVLYTDGLGVAISNSLDKKSLIDALVKADSYSSYNSVLIAETKILREDIERWEIILQEATGDIAFIVKDSETEEVLKDVSVSLYQVVDEITEQIDSKPTNENGEYLFENADRENTYQISLQKDSYLVLSKEIEPNTKDIIFMEKATSQNSGILVAYVVDHNQTPVQGAIVNVYELENGVRKRLDFGSRITDALGAVTIREVPSKNLLITASLGDLIGDKDLNLSAGISESVVITLNKRDATVGTLSVLVKDAVTNTPINDANVYVYEHANRAIYASGFSDDAGYYYVPFNDELNVDVLVLVEGYASTTKTIFVDDSTDLVFLMEQGSIDPYELSDKEIDPITGLPIDVNADNPELLSAFSPQIELVGIKEYGSASDEYVEIIVAGKMHVAEFKIRWPKFSFDKGGVHIRLGTDDEIKARDYSYAIDGGATGENFYGLTYNPPVDEYTDFRNRGFSKKSNKFVEMYRSFIDSDMETVKIRFNVSKDYNKQSIPIKYRGWVSKNNFYYRSPFDSELGLAVLSDKKASLYADTKETLLPVIKDSLECKEDVCFNYGIYSQSGYLVEENERLNREEKYFVLVNLVSKEEKNVNLKVKSSNEGIALSESFRSEQAFQNQLFPGETKEIRIPLSFNDSIQEGTIEVTLESDFVEFHRDFIKFKVEEIKELKVELDPGNVFHIAKRNNLRVKVTDENNTPVTDALVVLENEEGTPITETNLVSIRGTNTKDQGANGVYYFRNFAAASGRLRLTIEAPGFNPYEDFVFIYATSLFDLEENLYLPIPKETGIAGLSMTIENKFDYAIEDIKLDIANEINFPAGLTLVPDITEIGTLAPGTSKVINFRAEYQGNQLSSFHSIAEFYITGRVGNNFGSSNKSRLNITYNKDLLGECIDVISNPKLFLLNFLEDESNKTTLRVVNNCSTTLHNLSLYITNPETNLDIALEGSSQTETILPGERKFFLAEEFSGQKGLNVLEINLKGSAKVPNLQGQASIPVELRIVSQEQTEISLPLDVVIAEPASTFVINNANLDVWVSKDKPTVKEYIVRNVGLKPIKEFRMGKFVPKDIYAVPQSNIKVDLVEAPKNLLPGQSARLLVKYTAQTEKSFILDTQIEIVGVVGTLSIPKRIPTRIHSLLSQCIQVSLNQNKVSSEELGGIQKVKATIKNKCNASIVIANISIANMPTVNKYGSIQFNLTQEPLFVAPLDTKEFEISVSKTQQVSYSFALQLNGFVQGLARDIVSNQFVLNVEFGKAASNLSVIGDNVQIKSCETSEFETFSVPKIGVTCTTTYCDSVNLAAYLAQLMNKQVDTMASDIRNNIFRQGEGETTAVVGNPITKTVYFNNDVLTNAYISKVFSEAKYSNLNSKSVEEFPFSIDSFDSPLTPPNKIFVDGTFAGCGRYEVTFRPLVRVFNNEPSLTDMTILMSISPREQTVHCDNVVTNMWNFLPIDQGITVEQSLSTLPAIVKTLPDYEKQGLLLAKSLFNDETRSKPTSGRNTNMIEFESRTDLKEGVARLIMSDSPSGTPKVVKLQVDSKFVAEPQFLANAITSIKNLNFEKACISNDKKTLEILVLGQAEEGDLKKFLPAVIDNKCNERINPLSPNESDRCCTIKFKGDYDDAVSLSFGLENLSINNYEVYVKHNGARVSADTWFKLSEAENKNNSRLKSYQLQSPIEICAKATSESVLPSPADRIIVNYKSQLFNQSKEAATIRFSSYSYCTIDQVLEQTALNNNANAFGSKYTVLLEDEDFCNSVSRVLNDSILTKNVKYINWDSSTKKCAKGIVGAYRIKYLGNTGSAVLAGVSSAATCYLLRGAVVMGPVGIAGCLLAGGIDSYMTYQNDGKLDTLTQRGIDYMQGDYETEQAQVAPIVYAARPPAVLVGLSPNQQSDLVLSMFETLKPRSTATTATKLVSEFRTFLSYFVANNPGATSTEFLNSVTSRYGYTSLDAISTSSKEGMALLFEKVKSARSFDLAKDVFNTYFTRTLGLNPAALRGFSPSLNLSTARVTEEVVEEVVDELPGGTFSTTTTTGTRVATEVAGETTTIGARISNYGSRALRATGTGLKFGGKLVTGFGLQDGLTTILYNTAEYFLKPPGEIIFKSISPLQKYKLYEVTVSGNKDARSINIIQKDITKMRPEYLERSNQMECVIPEKYIEQQKQTTTVQTTRRVNPASISSVVNKSLSQYQTSIGKVTGYSGWDDYAKCDMTPPISASERAYHPWVSHGPYLDRGLVNVCSWNQVKKTLGGPVTGRRGAEAKPYCSVATDKSVIPTGSLIYIPKFDGKHNTSQYRSLNSTMQNYYRSHDGLFVADDVGGAIDGWDIDVFYNLANVTQSITEQQYSQLRTLMNGSTGNTNIYVLDSVSRSSFQCLDILEGYRQSSSFVHPQEVRAV